MHYILHNAHLYLRQKALCSKYISFFFFLYLENNFYLPQESILHSIPHFVTNSFITSWIVLVSMWLESNSHVYIVFNHFPADAHLSYCHFSGNKHHYTLYAREGNGNPLQYSWLENPMDGGAWWAAVHGNAKSRTRLSDFTFIHWRRKWQPTVVFSPGESQGWGSLVGCRLWGRSE